MDREGSLWLAAMGNGLIRQLGRGDWLSWKKEDGLLNNTVWAIHQDNAGQTWVGSNGGVNVIDSHGKVTHSWSSHDGLWLPTRSIRSQRGQNGGNLRRHLP